MGLALEGGKAFSTLYATAGATGSALDNERTPSMSHATVEVTKTSTQILAIIFEYALNKFDDSKERLTAGMPKFLSVVDKFVVAGTRLEMCLPAFPFKSQTRFTKCLVIYPTRPRSWPLND